VAVPHATNRAAFRDANASEPLFRLYTLLVAAELALKDAAGAYPHKHDLSLLAALHFGTVPSGLSAQLTALDKALGALACTFHNAPAPVDPKQYRGLRYLRLARDGFIGGSTDADVNQALADARAFVAELGKAGVAV
jgi:hypothetical protein